MSSSIAVWLSAVLQPADVAVGPVLVGGVGSLLGAPVPEALVWLSRLVGVPVVWGVWRASRAGEQAYLALERAEAVRIDDSRLKALSRPGGGDAAGVEVFERQSGKRFASTPDKTLLEAMVAAGVPIEFGCRSGLCGADPVGIVEGHQHLDEPGADEAATLRRLGLLGRARLACCARPCGPVVIDRDPRSVPPAAAARRGHRRRGAGGGGGRGAAPPRPAGQLLHRGTRLMDRQLDAEGAQRLAGYLENTGIAVLTEARLAGFEGRGHLDALRLEDGRRVEGDLFVACTGVTPNAELARSAGLTVGRGVRVDADMRTEDEAIYAVGDVAEPPTPGPLGLWPVAVEQAHRAARAMLAVAGEAGAPAAPRIVLQLESDGIDLRSFGNLESVPEGAEVLCADPTAVEWWRLVVRDGEVLAAVYVGPPGTAKALTRVLQSCARVDEALPALRQHRLVFAAPA